MDAELSTCVWTQLDCSGAVKKRVLERSCHTATLVGSYVYIIGGKRRSKFCDDVLRLNLDTKTWETVFSSLPFLVRANHSATLIGEEIWVVGGMSSKQVYHDVHVLNTTSLKWSTPTFKGSASLLQRCAHACCVNPLDPNSILLFGGYGGKVRTSGSYSFLNDLVVIHTDRSALEQVKCTSAAELPGRAYHTLTSVGTKCFSIGGKGQSGTIPTGHFLEVFDCQTCRWLSPPKISGQVPSARSSHKAAAVGSSIFIIGGVHGVVDVEQRFEDAAVLLVPQGPEGAVQLSWHSISSQGKGPAARSAHAVVVHGKRLLLLLGYRGNHQYLSDCWALESISGRSHTAGSSLVAAAPFQEAQHQMAGGDTDTTPSPDTTKLPAFETARLMGPRAGTATRKSRLASLLGGLSRTPKARSAGVGTARGDGASAEVGGGVVARAGRGAGVVSTSVKVVAAACTAGGRGGVASGTGSPVNKRPQLATPEWRNVKRAKAQDTPKPQGGGMVTPQQQGTNGHTFVFDLASEDASQGGDEAVAQQPATNAAADAVYMKKIKELEAQVSRLTSAAKENRTSESKLRMRGVALEAQVQDLMHDRERIQQLHSTTTKDLENREMQLMALNKKLQETQQQLARSQDELQEAVQQLAAARQEAEWAQQEAAAQEGATLKELSELKHQLAARTASSQQYQALSDQRRKEAEATRQQLAELHQRLQETAKKLAATTQDKQQLEGMLKEKALSILRLNSGASALREELKQQCIASERKSAEQTAAYEQLRGEHSSLHSAHQKLQDTLNSLSRTIESTRAELSEERRSRAAAAEGFARDKDALCKQLQEVKQKLAASVPELEHLRAYEASTVAEVERLSAELRAAKEREAALVERNAAARAEVTKLQGDNHLLSCQVESLRNAGNPLLGQARSLQEVVSTLVDRLQEHHTALSNPPTPTTAHPLPHQ